MKTRLLKRMRKAAKKEYKIEAFRDYYRIISYVWNPQSGLCPIVRDNTNMKEFAIKRLFEYRRNFILNRIQTMRTEKLNKELRKI